MNSDTIRFLTALYARSDGGFVELRPIRPRGGGALKQQFFAVTELSQVADRCQRLREAADVYVGVATRTRQEGTKAAIDKVPAVWVDFDRDDAALDIVEFPLSPSVVIESGTPGHLHAYWFLEEPIKPEAAEALNRALVAALDGDRQAVDAGRIMRPPDTINHKNDPATEVRLANLNERRYSAAELGAVLLRPSPQETDADPRTGEAPDATAAVQRVLARLDGVQRRGRGWRALCPAHDDHDPSLDIGVGDDGRCLLICRSRGCSAEAIAGKLGLEMADLFEEVETNGGSRRSQSEATRLVDMAHDEGIELFHDQQRRAFGRVPVSGHWQILPLTPEGCGEWLEAKSYRERRKVPGAQAVRDAVGVLAAEAKFDSPKEAVYRRIAGDLDRMWIDLGDPERRVAEIDAESGRWDIVQRSPVNFIQDPAAQALPDPIRGGSVDELRPLLNLPNDDAWILTRGFLLSVHHPLGPYGVGLFCGDSGSAKTMLAGFISKLTDPLTGEFPIGTPSVRNLMAGALSSWLVGQDNVSSIPVRLSDALCQLTSGAGVRERQLYTNAGLFVGEARRPVVMTALTNVATRADLVDRLISPPRLLRIPDGSRLDEQEVLAEFERLKGRIFAGQLDAIAAALRSLPEVRPSSLSRLASISRFITAAEAGSGWEVGAFGTALAESRAEGLDNSISASLVVDAVERLMTGKSEWEAEPADLRGALSKLVGDKVAASRAWPDRPEGMSRELDEQSIALREIGLQVSRGRRSGGDRRRYIRIERVG